MPESVRAIRMLLAFFACYGLAFSVPLLVVGCFLGPVVLFVGVGHGLAGVVALVLRHFMKQVSLLTMLGAGLYSVLGVLFSAVWGWRMTVEGEPLPALIVPLAFAVLFGAMGICLLLPSTMGDSVVVRRREIGEKK